MPLIILAVIVFISIYGFANYYIGLRGYQYLGSYIPLLNSKVYWLIFWIIALSFIIGRFNNRIIPQFIQNAFNLIGSFWMAVMLYSIIIFALMDISRLIIKSTGLKSLKIFQLHNFNLYAGILALVLIAGILAYGVYQGRNININSYDIKIQKNSPLQRLHIVFLSDTHLGNIVNNSRLESIVDKINNLEPDLVLLGGDLIDDSIKPYIEQGMSKTLKKIKSRYGVYAVLGNHDGSVSEVQNVIEHFETGGMQVLSDRYVNIGNSFYIVGRNDDGMPRGDKKRKPLEELLEGVDRSLPVILLDHNPSKLSEAAEQNIDLQLSGHTHGGQLFPARLITKRLYEKDWGYLKKDNFQLIVSSGAATWGPPIRTGSDSEIVDINIEFEKRE